MWYQWHVVLLLAVVNAVDVVFTVVVVVLLCVEP